MKLSVALFAIATVMLLVGLGIRMHADWKFTDKMYYHSVNSTLYEFDEVFAERELGDTIQRVAMLAGGAGGVWFVFVKLRRGP